MLNGLLSTNHLLHNQIECGSIPWMTPVQKMLSQNADVTAFAKVPATCAGVQNSADGTPG